MLRHRGNATNARVRRPITAGKMRQYRLAKDLIWLCAFFFSVHAQFACAQDERLLEPSEPLSATMSLATTEEKSPPTSTSSLLEGLDTALDFGDAAKGPKYLDPEDAFQLNITVVDTSTLLARVVIADGYYLYRDKTIFTATAGNARLAQYVLPPGKEKEDAHFGRMMVYDRGFEVPIGIIRETAAAGTVTIRVQYQGCAEQGICYPPTVRTIDVALAAMDQSDQTKDAKKSQGSADGHTVQPLTASAVIGYLAAAFGAGLLLTFTPCVLPMIPILSSIIVGQREPISKSKSGGFAIAYVLGTAVIYTLIGVIAGATGEQLQAYFQNGWAIGIVSAVLIAMALSMFGLYDLQIPSRVQSWLQSCARAVPGGSLGMAFLLGAASALIVGPCVSPLLVSALSVAIASADPVLGGAIMLFMALGMGIVLIALGFGAGFTLPTAGPWMERVRQALGIMLLGVAIHLLGILPPIPVLLLWAALLILTAVYSFRVIRAQPTGKPVFRYLAKAASTLILLWGALALIGGLAGNRDILNPLHGISSSDREPESRFVRVSSVAELSRELAAARSTGRPVILDYYADWCPDCKRLEKNTFQSPSVAAEMARFVLLQVDVTDPRDVASSELKQKYGIFGPPAVLFFDKEGHELEKRRFYGFRTADEFLDLIRAIH